MCTCVNFARCAGTFVFWSFPQEQEERDRLRKEEEKRQQEELADFERKIKGRKRKPRKQRQIEEEPSFMEKYRKMMIGAGIVLAIAVVMYYLWTDTK